jgi:hypothetical protein
MTPKIVSLIGAPLVGINDISQLRNREVGVHSMENGCTRKRGGKFWDDLVIPLPTNAEPPPRPTRLD